MRYHLIILTVACFILFSVPCYSQQPSVSPSPSVSPLVSPSTDNGTIKPEQPRPSPSPSVSQPLQGKEAKKFELPPWGSSVRQSVAKQIFQKMRDANSGLNDYVCPLTVAAKAKYSFLEVPFNLEGHYYFKSPDKYRVKFEKAPEFLSKYPQIFGWSLPEPSEYTIKIFEGTDEYSRCFMLRLIPVIGRGDLQKIEMWINKDNWLFPRQLYSYRDGGFIDVKCTYRKTNDFNLFDTMHMELNFPKSNIKASADALYGEYIINQGVSDQIFEQGK